MRLIQLIGDGIEELYYFPDITTDEQIKSFYKRYLEFDDEHDYENFEEYIEGEHPELCATRVFVDEIYV